MERLPLHPLRDVRRVRGPISDIISAAGAKGRDDYVSVTLTDEIDPYKPKEQLEKVYTHILEVRMDNERTRNRLQFSDEEIKIQDPLQAFSDFYHEMQSREMSEEEQKIMEQVFIRARGDAL